MNPPVKSKYRLVKLLQYVVVLDLLAAGMLATLQMLGIWPVLSVVGFDAAANPVSAYMSWANSFLWGMILPGVFLLGTAALVSIWRGAFHILTKSASLATQRRYKRTYWLVALSVAVAAGLYATYAPAFISGLSASQAAYPDLPAAAISLAACVWVLLFGQGVFLALVAASVLAPWTVLLRLPFALRRNQHPYSVQEVKAVRDDDAVNDDKSN